VNPHRSSLPIQFTQQLFDAIGSPDLVLALAAGNALLQSKRDALGNFLAAMGDAETLAIFFRAQLASEVNALKDAGRIFRDNSVGVASAGVILRAHGKQVINDIYETIAGDSGAKPIRVLQKWYPIWKKVPQSSRVVLRSVFLAGRRKFPDGLVSLNGIAGVLMLRYVMADLSPKLPPEQLQLLQTLMTLTVFKSGTCEVNEFEQTAEALLELTKLKNNNIPKDQYSVEKLLDAMTGLIDDIIKRITPSRKPEDHPVIWSTLEMLETMVTGLDEDLRQRLVGVSVFGS
jgi:hypothetical protein